MTTNISLYIVKYNEKYIFLYNRNVCCHYISSYIMTTNISLIQENVYRVTRDDV